MEVIKEGTHTYLLKQIEYRTPAYDESVVYAENESWDYYLSVEYEVLKRNELKTLVSAQLREKDEEKSLLFDITGKRPLKRQGKERAFSQKECEKILQNMRNMIQEVEDYMLDLNCIELRPEYIYEDSKGEIQWIYFPQTSLESEIKSSLQDRELQNKNEDLQKRMEALFAWMLPQIDYEDTDAVQFMYRFYNKVRKLGFSKELLETYIQTKIQKEYYDIEEVDKTSEKVRDSSKIKQDRKSNNEGISYEEFFKEELELEKQKIESPNNRKEKTGDFRIGIKNGKRNSRREVQRNERNRDEKNKNQSNRNQKNKDLNNRNKSQSNENNYFILYNGLKIISVICTFLAVILEGIFVFYGMRSGFTRQLFQYSVGGMLLIIVFACGFIWSTQAVRKIKQMSDEFIQEKELQNRPQMIKTEVDWETEGDWESGTEGTTILNYGNESEKEDGKICHPMLRDMELGIIYVIKNCPFYIGSAEGVNHLHIQDKTVSREHAVILEDIYEGDGQGYILRDMGSTNGTWLNGKKIKRGNQEQLEDGAVIRFAKKEYEFLIQDI
mgnify:CR=1 FL=1